MLKGEIEILAAIVLNKRTGKQLTTGRFARYSPYIISTLETLRQKEYIVHNKTKGYIITEKGIRALAEFYPKHEALDKAIHHKLLRQQTREANKAIRMIEQLSSDYNVKMDGLQKIKGKNISPDKLH
jgi:Mn-dependent DtxR family transcriptional regulator